jgi:serine/threonine protein kinase
VPAVPIDPNRVKALFVAAVDLPPGERTAFVVRECGADAALRTRLDELLAAHDGAATVDAAPGTAAYDPDATRTADTQPLGATGEVIGGKYHLIDEVGTGGMGSVWRAEQRVPVKRYVAVKLIKAGMDSKAVLARFDAERQALAVMDHPNIARVFDGGVTADGRPYFVMELVKGTPITTFCDVRKLTPRQRLELFVPVCSAIQHAHMKGVIHRDIKPSNVLVALYDDKAVPKVIDFGIAKATGAALTDHTLNTGFGAVVGTPEYMSPEQASLNNLDIDTRSDVYALGVLLYELLTGSPPFTRQELEVKGLLELLRVVREVEPPRPSVKLSTASAKPSIAANRGTGPTPLTKLLRSELDWLVMKALEKDRNRRYDSANGFAADVQRHLAGEQVQAVPPSLGYRVRKWVRKNRGLVTTSGLVAASLLAGTGVSTWQAIRAEQEAERARSEEQKVREEQAKTQAALEQAQVNLVHSYLRAIGFNTDRLDQAELIALDELARQDDDRIKLLFLREAMAANQAAIPDAERSRSASSGYSRAMSRLSRWKCFRASRSSLARMARSQADRLAGSVARSSGRAAWARISVCCTTSAGSSLRRNSGARCTDANTRRYGRHRSRASPKSDGISIGVRDDIPPPVVHGISGGPRDGRFSGSGTGPPGSATRGAPPWQISNTARPPGRRRTAVGVQLPPLSPPPWHAGRTARGDGHLGW